jgi:hypothetical protein
MKKLILSLFIMALGISFTGATYGTIATSTLTFASAESEESVFINCHQKTYSIVITQKSLYSGKRRDCKRCHIKQVETEARKDIPVLTYAMENLIFLDVRHKSSYSVRVKVKDSEGRKAVSSEVRFTPSTVTTNITNDNMPPLISNLRVEELKEGVFYSAVLAWETNELSSSAVEYGFQGAPVNLFSMGNQYTTNHRIIFSGLVSGKVYIFRVISKDPFGNTAGSEDLRVSVENPFSDKKEEELGEWPSVKEVSVVKVGEKIALRWKTNIETAAVVELSEVVSSERFSKEPPYLRFIEPLYTGLYDCISES